MPGRLEALRQLSAALLGRPLPDTDWLAVVELANRSLVTPQLHAALLAEDALHMAPPEYGAFTAEAFARNRERNQRLFAQLQHAIAALNRAGVEPMLLKGAALWAALGRPPDFDRMLTDIDILVEPEEAPLAIDALGGAGFQTLRAYDEPWRHVVAELARPGDVGVIDLHRRPPGPLKTSGVTGEQRRFEWEGLRAALPSPAAQVVMLAMHDQFHERAYWRGDISLRHLLDIAALAPQVDWDAVTRLAGERLILRAVAVQVAAAERFAGAQAQWGMVRRPAVRLHHMRQLVQFASPGAAAPLAWLAALSEASSLVGRRRLVGDGPGGLRGRFARFRTVAG